MIVIELLITYLVVIYCTYAGYHVGRLEERRK